MIPKSPSKQVRIVLTLGILLNTFPLQYVYAARFFGWGSNGNGQTTLPSYVSNVIAIAAGKISESKGHTLAISADGTLFAWGNNKYGQATVPEGLSNVTAISAGVYHSLALTIDGTVTVFGSQSPAPPGLSNVTAIAGGYYHSLALKNDGTVVAWDPPYVPPGLSNVVKIAAGYGNIALKADGSVVCWDYMPRYVPPEATNIVRISAGNHYLGLRADGTVLAWDVALLNDVPAGLSDVIDVAAAGGKSLVLKSDGTIAVWGDLYTPIPPPVSNVVAIAAGGSDNLVLIEDLQLRPLELSNQTPVLRFHTFTNKTYAVEFSDGIAPPNWSNLPGGTVSGTGNEISVTDTNSVAISPGRYYRLKLLP